MAAAALAWSAAAVDVPMLFVRDVVVFAAGFENPTDSFRKKKKIKKTIMASDVLFYRPWAVMAALHFPQRDGRVRLHCFHSWEAEQAACSCSGGDVTVWASGSGKYTLLIELQFVHCGLHSILGNIFIFEWGLKQGSCKVVKEGRLNTWREELVPSWER